MILLLFVITDPRVDQKSLSLVRAFSSCSHPIFRLVSLIILAALVSTTAYAMRVSPMIIEMGTTGSAAIGRIEV